MQTLRTRIFGTRPRVTVVAVLVFLFILFAPRSKSDQEVAVVAPTQAPIPTLESTSVPTIGQDIRLGDVRWKFLEAIDAGNKIDSTSQIIPGAITTGKFLRVRFEVENLGKDQIAYSAFAVKDARGRTFTPISKPAALMPNDENCGQSMGLNPNLPRTCQLIFEMPTDATRVTAEVDSLQGLITRQSALITLTP